MRKERAAPPVVRRKIIDAFDLAGEKSSAEWAIGHESYPKLAYRIE